jgi:DnaJ family protein B protein 4
MSYYETLEVPETATMEEIKKSYRQLSLKYHPDRNPGKPEMVAKFQKIGEAYEILGDEQKKEEYDMMNKNPFAKMMSQGGGGMHMGPMGGIDEIFSSLFGMPFGGMNMGHMGGINMGPMGNNPNIRVFRNGVQVNLQQALQKPPPIIKTISINMEQVFTGGSIPVEIERWLMERENKMFETETIYVNIPKGIDDNEIIILRDKGNVLSDEVRGDIKLFVKVENTTDFERNGLDLLIHKNITLKDALCGFSFELKYINNKVFSINNNVGSIIQPEYKKVIPNMGLMRDIHVGNMIIWFHVQFPEKLDIETIEKLKLIL